MASKVNYGWLGISNMQWQEVTMAKEMHTFFKQPQMFHVKTYLRKVSFTERSSLEV